MREFRTLVGMLELAGFVVYIFYTLLFRTLVGMLERSGRSTWICS